MSIDGFTPPKDERKPKDMAGRTPCAVRVTVRYYAPENARHNVPGGILEAPLLELFVIIDIFFRYVVGWMVSPAETGELAEAFIADTLATHGIARDQLTLHADRGTSMTSKPVAQLLIDLGVARSHSRPHVSNDNPYSEANLKTLKYCPAFPGRFGSIEDAHAFCAAFFDHYNHVHRHAGIGLHTPASVHYGTADEIRARAPSPSTPPTPPTRHDSVTADRRRPSCPPSPGSTNPAPTHSSDPHKKLSRRA